MPPPPPPPLLDGRVYLLASSSPAIPLAGGRAIHLCPLAVRIAPAAKVHGGRGRDSRGAKWPFRGGGGNMAPRQRISRSVGEKNTGPGARPVQTERID